MKAPATGLLATVAAAALGLAFYAFLPATRPASAGPPIVLLTFDTTRADRLSLYGHPRPTTPRLDALHAAGAVRFDRMTSASNNTSCSFASIHSGVHVRTHGVIKLAPFGFPLPEEFPTIAEVLRAAGYRTVAAVGASHLGAEVSGLGRGFEKFFEPAPPNIERSCESTNEELLPYLEAIYSGGRESRPLFLWLHYFDPHAPYEPPAPFVDALGPASDGADADGPPPERPLPPGFLSDQRGAARRGGVASKRALYEGEIRRTDHAAGEVLDALRRLSILDRAAVVFTADHGENLGEHGLFFNHIGLYEPVVHVPLLVRLPGMTEPAATDALAHHVDIAPTIFDVAGIPRASRPAGLEGESLVPLLSGTGDLSHRDVVFSESVHCREKCVRSERGEKLVFDGAMRKAALFELATDPGERRDVAAAKPDVARRFALRLRDFMGEKEYRMRIVAPSDASARETVGGSVFVTDASLESVPTGLGPGTSRRLLRSFRHELEPGGSAELSFSVAFGAFLLRASSSRAPLGPKTIRLAGDLPVQELSLGYAFLPGDEADEPDRAPASDAPLVRVVPSGGGDAAGSARYRVTLGPTRARSGDPTLVFRVGTEGTVTGARGLEGPLEYREFGNADRFVVALPDPDAVGDFTFDVAPADAALYLEAKIGERLLENTEFRVVPKGAPGEDRAYLTTFFFTENLLQSAAARHVDDSRLRVPGFHVWMPGAGRATKTDAPLDPEYRRRLEALGYGAGGRER